MGQNDKLNRIWPLVWKPAVSGIACGALFGIFSALRDYLWQNEYDNTNLGLLIYAPSIAVILLLVLLSAFLAITFTYRQIKSPIEAVLPGAVAGIVLVLAALFFSTSMSLIMLSPLFTSKGPGVYNMFDGFLNDPAGYFIKFFSVGATFIVLYSLISAAITSVAAMVYTALILRQQGGEKKINRAAIIITTSMIALMIIVPPAIASIGLSMGWIDGSWSDYFHSVSVDRLDDNTMAVNYTGGANLHFDRDMPFTIAVFGADGQMKNATSMEAIGQSGLSATITPAGGLKSEEGASVVLSGSDLKKPVHMIVTEHLADGSSMVVMDTCK